MTTTTDQTTEQPETAYAGDRYVCQPWCNRPHQAGANPRRQHHENVWRSTGGDLLPLRATFYPVGPRPRFAYEAEGCSYVSFTCLSQDLHTVLSTEDIRALAARLVDIADAAQHGERW